MPPLRTGGSLATPRWRELALALVLAALQATLLVRTAWDKADVVDEPVYLTAATRLWYHADFTYNRESPVLPKWGFALALRALVPRFAELGAVDEGSLERRLLWSQPIDGLRRTLLCARLATILVTVGGGLLLWRAGRRLGGGVGLLSQALWCFSPMVLSNGALAKLDAWSAAAIALVLVLMLRLCERPGWVASLWVGLALGTAAACKVPTLGALPVTLAVAGVVARRGRDGWLRRWLGWCAMIVAGTVITLWAAYGLSVGSVDWSRLATQLGDDLRRRAIGPVPFPAWIEGILVQVVHGTVGHRKYLFGMSRVDGVWWYYLAVLALRTTLAVQLLALMRVVSMLWRPRWSSLSIDTGLLAFPLLLLVVMSAGNTQHEAYLLPAFPPTLLWLGRSVTELRRGLGARGPVVAWLCGLLAGLASISVHPHHLMFFNTWAGGPEGGPRYLIVGNDAGQDKRRLGEWQRERGIQVLYYAPYTGEPEAWGIRWQSPPCSADRTPEDPAIRRGAYALQAVEVHRPRRLEPGCLDWLTVEPPDERIGYSIYIYIVDKERLERLRAERWTDRPFFRSGPVAPGASAPP